MSVERITTTTPDPNPRNLESVGLVPQATPPAYQEGLLWYDKVHKTISIYNNQAESSLQVGQELWIRCYNSTGNEISNGKVVYVSGANGEVPSITLAKADKISTSTIIGMTTTTIPNGTEGLVTIKGLVHDVDTTLCISGDPIFLSDSTAGAFTKTPPSGLSSVSRVGVVNSVGVTGTILIDTVILGRAENPRAEIYITNNAGQTTINTVNVWETIIQLTQNGNTIGFTFNGAGVLTADNTVEKIAGVYSITAAISSAAVSANKDYEIGVFVNEDLQTKTISKRRYSSGDTGTQSLSGLLSIVSGDNISIRIRNITDSTNIIIVDANFNMIKLGE